MFNPVCHDKTKPTDYGEEPSPSSSESQDLSLDEPDPPHRPDPDRLQHPDLTADDYREAFVNIQQGVVRPQDCLVLVAMLRAADTDKLADGLQLVLKLSVTSAENKVLYKHNQMHSTIIAGSNYK